MAKQQTAKPQGPKSPKFVQVHYSELAGETLAFAVAEALNKTDEYYVFNDDGTITNVMGFAPQDDWNQAKEYFERFAPSFTIHRIDGKRSYYAVLANSEVAHVVGAHGPNHAVALLRAVVLTALDEEDDKRFAVPEQYIDSQVAALAIEKRNPQDAQGQLALDSGPQDIAPAPSQEQRDAHRANKAQEAQEGTQEAKAPSVQATPAPKAEEKPAAQAKPAQDKPADKPTGKPLPQGKQAQAMKDHGKPQGAK